MAEVLSIVGDVPRFRQRVILDTVEFVLEFAWNSRDSRWYVSVAQSDGTALASGVPLVVDYPLFRKFVSTSMPAGRLMAVDVKGNGEEISTMDDLGDRVQVVYLTEAEAAELEFA